MSDWIKSLQEASSDRAEKVPKDFLTRRQVALETGYSQSNAQKVIAALMLIGKAEMKLFSIPTAAGVRPVPHYRLLKK